jgi:hypothetical protein
MTQISHLINLAQKLIALWRKHKKGDDRLFPTNWSKFHDINTAADLSSCTPFRFGGSEREGRMTYKARLHPWCIIRHLPDEQPQVVAHLRRRNEAENQIRLLQQKTPNASYSIIYDPMAGKGDSTTESQQPPKETVTPV